MKIIQEHTLEAAIEKFDGMEDEEAQKVIDDLAGKQPAILAYAFAVEDEFEDEGAFELFLEYIAIIWIAFEMEFDTIQPITEQEILDKEDQLEEESLALEGMSEEQMVEVAMEKYGDPTQPVVMGYIFQQLIDLQDEEELPDEAASALITNLTFLVELLDDAANKPNLRVV